MSMGTSQVIVLTEDQQQKISSAKIKVLAEQEIQLSRTVNNLTKEIAQSEIKLEGLNSFIVKSEADKINIEKALESLESEYKKLDQLKQDALSTTASAIKEELRAKDEVNKSNSLNSQITLEIREKQSGMDQERAELTKKKEQLDTTRKQITDYLRNILI